MINDGQRWVTVAILVAIITCGMWYWVRGERIFGANFVPGIGAPTMKEEPGRLPGLAFHSGGGRPSVEHGGELPDFRPTAHGRTYSTLY